MELSQTQLAAPFPVPPASALVRIVKGCWDVGSRARGRTWAICLQNHGRSITTAAGATPAKSRQPRAVVPGKVSGQKAEL